MSVVIFIQTSLMWNRDGRAKHTPITADEQEYFVKYAHTLVEVCSQHRKQVAMIANPIAHLVGLNSPMHEMAAPIVNPQPRLRANGLCTLSDLVGDRCRVVGLQSLLAMSNAEKIKTEMNGPLVPWVLDDLQRNAASASHWVAIAQASGAITGAIRLTAPNGPETNYSRTLSSKLGGVPVLELKGVGLKKLEELKAVIGMPATDWPAEAVCETAGLMQA